MAGRAICCRTRKPCSGAIRTSSAFDQNNQRLPYLDELIFLVVPDQDAADLKFRSGGLDGVDDVKPENYRWYEDNQKRGNFTLHDLGAAQNTPFVLVQPEQGPAAGPRRPRRRTESASATVRRSA